MRVLVLNCGSSSIKVDIIDTEACKSVLSLNVEKINKEPKAQMNGEALAITSALDFDAILTWVMDTLSHHDEIKAISGVAHRVVHGGKKFTQACLVTSEVVAEIERLSILAPLHNPINLKGIRVAMKYFPQMPQVAVFDTAFHQSLPSRAHTYAIDQEISKKHDLRRYGFHGISHRYVSYKAAEYLSQDISQLRLVVCHLGNGCSITAVEFGKSVETSMGLTPLEGLVMGTRPGDLDPGLIGFLQQNEGWSPEQLDDFLNKKCGLMGLSGKTNDMREIIEYAAEGDEGCQLAFNVFCHRLRKYIGAYLAVLGGADAVVFTGGIGENSALVRARVCERLEFLGLMEDEQKNKLVQVDDQRPVQIFSKENSRIKLLVVKTDEELAIAKRATEIIKGNDTVNSIPKIPIAISARHVHLTRETLDVLFGEGYELTTYKPLSQPGQFAANETVTIIGPKNKYENVRILGPIRPKDQVEISRTDEYFLGIDAPIRESGHVEGSGACTLVGPKGEVYLKEGVICAWRHIHMHPNDAASFGVKDKDIVEVEVADEERPLVFKNVLIRVSDKYALEMHIDTDEGNAAEVRSGEEGVLCIGNKEVSLLKRKI
ncbi:MAG: acetate/propionate family kinase [Chitinophagales bacterium]|nr:acetate/propionate family kinase [Chitinophagales bacterium]